VVTATFKIRVSAMVWMAQFSARSPPQLNWPATTPTGRRTQRGSDGEPLDALVLRVEATYPGRVRARVVGMFWVMTGHGREAKLVCLPGGIRRTPASTRHRGSGPSPAPPRQDGLDTNWAF
jgi:hypothetical protein